MCKQTLGPHRRRFYRTQTHSRKPPAGSNQKISSAQQKTQSPGNNWPNMQMRDKMEFALLLSIKSATPRQFCGDEVKRSSQKEEINPSPVARRLAVILSRQCALTSGPCRKWGVVCEKQHCFAPARQSHADHLEAYLEQSSPAPPPCTPTILHEFLVDRVAL